MPSVSVVIPAYNRERYLAEAISSVLAQGLDGTEVIVVDDGSTDGTAAAATRFPGVACLRLQHRGAAAARNAGIAAAGGELLAFLDSDDLWAPGKLASQLARLQERPEVGLVSGLVEEFVSPELPAALAARLSPAPGPRPAWLAGAMLVRRAAFAAVGMLDETLRVGEVVDWLARARELGVRGDVVPRVVLRRRLHDGNLGRGGVSQRLDYARVVKARLDRARAGGR
jgi:glycosyltransferase involved in cell wall biosynthesis